MSKHWRIRSRTGAPRPRGRRRSRASLPLVVAAAALGLLSIGAGWVYTARHPDTAPAAGPVRPAADVRADSAAAQDSRGRSAGQVPRTLPGPQHRAPGQGLPGVSDRTRARIPADSRQLVLVTGEAEDSSESTAALYTRPAAGADWVRVAGWPARNGARGWSADRTQGDLTSPEGVFTLTDAGGLLPKPPGTKLPYDQDRLFVPTGSGVNGEPLDGAFDYVVAIDFNRRPGVSPLDPTQPDGEDKGGYIWLHVDHDGPSQGCVGIPKEGMEKILATLDPAAQPVIVMGPRGF